MQKQSDVLSPNAIKNYSINMNEMLRGDVIKSNSSTINKEVDNDKEYVIKNYRLVY